MEIKDVETPKVGDEGENSSEKEGVIEESGKKEGVIEESGKKEEVIEDIKETLSDIKASLKGENERIKEDLRKQREKMEQMEIDMIKNSPRKDYIGDRCEGFYNYDVKASKFIHEDSEREYQYAAKILDDVLGHG